MSKFIYIDSYVIKDFNNSPFFQKLVNLCSTNPAKKKAVIVNSPNEKKIFDYFLATGLKFSSENPKDCGDATFIGRDIRSLHNKTGNNIYQLHNKRRKIKNSSYKTGIDNVFRVLFLHSEFYG